MEKMECSNPGLIATQLIKIFIFVGKKPTKIRIIRGVARRLFTDTDQVFGVEQMRLFRYLQNTACGFLGSAKSSSELTVKRSRRLHFQALERRELFAGLQFDSLTSIGTGVDSSIANAVDTDQLGNAYVTGRFSGTVDFDPDTFRFDASDVLSARGIADVYVAKYAPNGELDWVMQWGGTDASNLSGDVGATVKVDAAGNIHVGGSFMGITSIGTRTLVSVGSADVFLVKLNSTGTVLNAKSWGGTGFDSLVGLDLEPLGGVIASSETYAESMIVKKFSPQGTETWSKTISTNARNTTQGDLVVDGVGNIYVTSNFSGTVDFDPSANKKLVSAGTSSSGIGTSFVLSLNSAGNLRWVSPFLAQRSDNGFWGSASTQSLAVDKLGNIVVGGFRNGKIDFQASSVTVLLPNEVGGFLATLNSSSGLLNWVKSFDAASGTVYVEDLEIDATGSIFVTGAFYGTIDFDPNSGTNSQTSIGNQVGITDAYLMKLSGVGQLDWVEVLGSSGTESGKGLSLDGNGGIQLVGVATNSTVDFDPDIPNSGEMTVGAKAKGFRVRLRIV